jgi:FAD/FMN-containing dehydrogenase
VKATSTDSSVEVCGWGRFPSSRATVVNLRWRGEPASFNATKSFLPFGMGRSYGDSCLNDGQALLSTRGLDKLISFDAESGHLVAETGVSFDAILAFAIPRGWFLPVTPGTRFVTLGGAIANDVHGKNHHCAGTFGHHTVRFQLLRSDGSRLICSREENQDWFKATVGGLGLTGLIEWAEVRLKPIVNSWIDSETIRYGDLDDFYALSADSEGRYDYLVAWVDSLAQGSLEKKRGVGRGLFVRGNHNRDPLRKDLVVPRAPGISVPVDPPFGLINRLTLRMFNAAYYRAMLGARQSAVVPLAKFFYPLDAIGMWNRIYGRKGLIQWQALIPLTCRDLVREILAASASSGSGSFLTVMKVMGEMPPAGLLSFSGRGVTIALDFPYDPALLQLLERFDEMVADAGGRLYPAKDARMSGVHFRRYYPQWETFLPFIDPKFSSSFWRRVMA